MIQVLYKREKGRRDEADEKADACIGDGDSKDNPRKQAKKSAKPRKTTKEASTTMPNTWDNAHHGKAWGV